MSQALSNAPIIDLYAALEPAALQAWIDDKFGPRETRTNELLASYKRFLTATAAGIPDDAVAGKATDFARQLKAEVKEIDATRTDIKAPVLAAQRQIDGIGRKFSEPLVGAMTEVEKRVTVFLRAKEQEARRVAAEEAARKEAEAQALLDQAAEAASEGDIEAEADIIEQATTVMAEAQAAEIVAEARPAELTRVRTQFGTTTALKDNWVYSVDDISQVPAVYLLVNDAVVKASIRSGARSIPGLSIRNEPKASIR